MSDASQPWKRIRDVVEKTLELSAEERWAVLQETRLERPEILPSIERVLEYEGKRADAAAPASEEGWEGRRLGPYEVLYELGRGGMGAVYLAERADGEFEQEVAIKVIQGGPLDEETLARFLDERQILARLVHPNIARLLDGGTTPEGVPYLVMERIEGEPITSYCRARGLSLEERLDLFRQVCEAVDQAHRSLVVHLDLKPGNILVVGDGQVKLLDFGVAKLLDSRPGAAGPSVGSSPMTPRYASPEQILGEPVSTASDVYSLGVVLYELLSGTRPFPGKGARLVLKVIEVERPMPPSQAAATRPVSGERSSPRPRDFGGDLDRIVLKAMARNPYERYGSAAELAADLERYREHRPVSAVPWTASYRLRKFVRRHRPSVVAGALLLLTLGAGLVARSMEAAKAQRERDAAQAARNRAEDLASFMLRDLWRNLEPLGRLDLLGPVAHRLKDYYESRPPETLSPVERQRKAEVLGALGSVLNDSGDLPAALQVLDEQLRLLEADARSGEAPALRRLVEGLSFAASVQRNGMFYEQALTTLNRARQLAEEGHRRFPDDPELGLLTAKVSDEIGIQRYDLGDLRAASEAFEAAWGRLEGLQAPSPNSLAVDDLRSAVALHRGVVLEDLGEYQRALPPLSFALDYTVSLHRRHPGEWLHLVNVVIPLTSWSRVQRELGSSEAGRERLLPILDELRQASSRDPTNVEICYQLSVALQEASNLEKDQGRTEEARSLLEEILERTEPFAATSEFVYVLDARVRAFLGLGRVEEARGPALDLLARGWGHQGFAELCSRHGITPPA
ncbi:MAG: serine/threonine protein kinase [Acidobacteria bacterium]|nr:serine/threonine protein kinase [Acidobacteriota bacterium]